MIRRLYHFLGGIKFAIFLISTTALFVIAGTLIESKTESHLYASSFTYSNPLFSLLIWGFFINILFSATRRWPFKKKHVPFLITHLGLLMMLSGVLIKNYFGTQGTMMIMEGSGSDEIVLQNTFVLHLEDEKGINQVELYEPYRKNPDLNIKVLDYHPHSVETLETWIKGDKGYIFGIKPFLVNDGAAPLQSKTSSSLLPDYPDFDIMAVTITNEKSVGQVAEELYLKDLKLNIVDKKSRKTLFTGNLTDNPNFHLNFDFSTFLGFSEPTLKVIVNKSEEIYIPLIGDKALINMTTYLGSNPFKVDLSRKPLLLIIQDKEEDTFIFVYDKAGRVLMVPYPKGQINSYLAYNKGFNGYTVPLKFQVNALTAQEIEDNQILKLKKELKLPSKKPLIAPLQLLKNACEREHLDFADTLVNFLISQDLTHLMIDDKNLPKMDFDPISEQELKACAWISALLPPILQKLNGTQDFFDLLEIGGWPLIEDLKKLNNEEFSTILDELVSQIYWLTDQLPEINTTKNNLFSSYLRLYSVRLKNLLPSHDEDLRIINLECPLTHQSEKIGSLHKIEENLPLVTLKVNHELITLTYDRFGTGIKWPILRGRNLIRFQPQFKTIPYGVRLQNARQINYPNSNSSFSFEADLIVTDKKNLAKTEITISMNNVHETWDGYRFYLSNISPGNELSVQHAQIVVNHDPAKYFLTYPGAIILSLGIILLFWFKKQ